MKKKSSPSWNCLNIGGNSLQLIITSFSQYKSTTLTPMAGAVSNSGGHVIVTVGGIAVFTVATKIH
jgi:hypothetical protein